LRLPRPIPGLRPWFAFFDRQPSLPTVFCLRWPLLIATPITTTCGRVRRRRLLCRIGEKTELQGARRGRDELGHQPLSYEREIRVSRELQLDPGLLDPAPDGSGLRTECAGDVGERLLEDIVQNERPEVGPAQGVATHEVPQTRAEQLPVGYRPADRARGLAVHLGDA